MSRVLIYLLRRDLRLADNPIFHELARLNSQSQKPFTHLLPVYVFPAAQVEISGFLEDGQRSPYKEARSSVGGFWRCGRLRAKFLAESVWDLKKELDEAGSGLEIRVGTLQDAVRSILDGFRDQKDVEVHGVWMTSEEGWEEKQEERQVERLMNQNECEFKLWTDEKYFVDDRDIPFEDPRQLSDVFTSYRKTVEPLRAAPRKQLPKPDKLPSLPEQIPQQASPFRIPDNLHGLISALQKPISENQGFSDMPSSIPSGVESAHPFNGGSKAAHQRVRHLIDSGAMTTYKDTRNGLLGLDFATKLAGFLSLGCISARQVHWQMLDFEDGKGEVGKNAQGYGKGENKGTAGVRFELLWRDYMRLCTKKFRSRLFFVEGYKGDTNASWKYVSSPYSNSTDKKNKKGANDEDTRRVLLRFLQGRTGTGLIDASQRELFLTGWTSNRARQNVASYLSKHLGIDWRLGAEWYEANLVDFDVSSNWGNWQYVAGVGNDPRGDARVFNLVKQAMDYDTNGEYVRAWVPELRNVGRNKDQSNDGGVNVNGADRGNDPETLMGVFQAWRLPDEEKKRLGLEGVEWVEHPLKKIDFSINRRGGGGKRGRGGGGGRGKGGGGQGRGRGNDGRSQRSGMMEKAGWQ